MSVELATAYISLVPSMQGMQGAITKEMGGLKTAGVTGGNALGGGILAGASKAIAPIAGVLAGAFAVRTVVDWAADSVNALKRIETINAQTVAAIKSTGGAANVSAEHVADLATSIEKYTSTEAESVQEGANLLLTFKNIQNQAGEGNDIFDQATKVMVDMARAMGTDVPGGAIQLGKALNDPIAGIAALSRVGVTFTDDQKNVIKALVDTGKTAEAQKVILDELNKEFGGSGAAYAATYAGKIDAINNAFGDIGESLFASVLPGLSTLADSLLPILQGVQDSEAFAKLKEQIDQIDWVAVGQNIGDAAGNMVELGTQVGNLITAYNDFNEWFIANDPLKAANQSGLDLRTGIQTVFNDLGISFSGFGEQWANGWNQIVAFMNGAGGAISGVGQAIVGTISWLVLSFANGWNQISSFTSQLVGNFQNGWNQITGAVSSAAGAIIGVIAGLVGSFSNGWNQIISGAQGMLSFLGGIPGQIQGFFAGAGSWLFSAGQNIINGLVNGIRSAVGNIASAAAGAVTTAINAAKAAAGIQSPSKVFRDEIGKQLGAGMVLGLQDSRGDVLSAAQSLVDVAPRLSLSPVSVGPMSTPTPGVSSGFAAAGAGVNIELATKGGIDLLKYVEVTVNGAVYDAGRDEESTLRAGKAPVFA